LFQGYVLNIAIASEENLKFYSKVISINNIWSVILRTL